MPKYFAMKPSKGDDNISCTVVFDSKADFDTWMKNIECFFDGFLPEMDESLDDSRDSFANLVLRLKDRCDASSVNPNLPAVSTYFTSDELIFAGTFLFDIMNNEGGRIRWDDSRELYERVAELELAKLDIAKDFGMSIDELNEIIDDFNADISRTIAASYEKEDFQPGDYYKCDHC